MHSRKPNSLTAAAAMKKRRRSSAANTHREPEHKKKVNVYFDEELEPVEVKMVPDDQLTLTEAELDEEFTKTLTSLDPNKPLKITHFGFKSGQFESKSNNQHLAVHFNKDGVIWSKKEKEHLAKLQREKEREELEQQNENKNNEEAKDEEKGGDDENAENQASDNKDDTQTEQDDKSKAKDKDNEKNDDKKEAETAVVSPTTKKREILVKNQFNFSERASQTFNEPLRDREIQTEPAPKSVFSQNANPSAIRDEYLQNLLKIKQQQSEDEKKKRSSVLTNSNNEDGDGGDDDDNHADAVHAGAKDYDTSDAILHSKEMLKALKIMERVAVLNANSESYNAFRYYKDKDYKRGAFASRLWTFKYVDEKSHSTHLPDSRMVTCLEWNKLHLDLFAVGYGSYNFNVQTSGLICVYSLKSTVFPEKIIHCESGVMCMSFHPKYASLLCVGAYDGSVAVYDIRNRDDSPIYSSQNPETYHSDPVWDIKWNYTELQPQELSFCSISSDSQIKVWKMTQNELNHETLIKLTTPSIACYEQQQQEQQKAALQTQQQQQQQPDSNGNNKENEFVDNIFTASTDADARLQALCSCFDFNPVMEHVYLVGTEDGHIMECSKTYSDGYTNIYLNAHFMNIYCIKWNPFHSKIFLTCSEDWTIKLWEVNPNSTSNGTGNNNKVRENPNGGSSDLATEEEEVYANNIIMYDLGSSVNDIQWAPYSSTVFAAVTSDGKVHIFDLAQNKNAPLCTEKIAKKSKNCKLTKVSFPIGLPLVIVGDEKGNVYALKVSPNLYLDKVKHRDILKTVSPQMFDGQDFKEKEREKLVNVLNVTGNKVFDVIQHLSPKKVKMVKKVN